MGLFNRKKTDDDKKADDKTAKVEAGKKEEKVVKKEEKKEKESMKDLYEGTEKKTKATKKETKKAVNVSSSAYKVLIKPLITEKAADLGSLNKYVFEIGLKANKVEVAKAVENVYGIKPISVNIVRMDGKKVRRGRITGRRKDWKKAVVTLPKGKTIQVYEGI